MKRVSIYTDGSSRGNPGPGGYGTILEHKGHLRELSQGYVTTTNNRMELRAALAGLETLKEACAVDLYSDSKYLIDAMNQDWIGGWKKKGWSRGPRKPLKNVDLWQAIDAARERHQMTWHWVKGHAGHEQNERCDELATNAADGEGKIIDQGYTPEDQ